MDGFSEGGNPFGIDRVVELAGYLERGADDDAVSRPEKFSHVLHRDTAAKQNLRAGTGLPDALHFSDVGGDAGAGAGNGNGAGAAAPPPQVPGPAGNPAATSSSK